MKKVYIQQRSELFHYASPYYDPVKAHEYYMKNRELKGRRSTAGLNETGKNAASYVKQQIYAERDSKLAERKDRYTNDRTSESERRANTNKSITQQVDSMVKSENEKKISSIEQHSTQMKNQISSLSETMKQLTAEEKKGPEGERIREEIAKLRESNAAQKEKIRNEAKAAIAGFRESGKQKRDRVSEDYRNTTEKLREDYGTDRKSIKSEYEEKYLSELDNIKSDPSMLKTKKSSSTNKTSTKTTSSKTNSSTKNSKATSTKKSTSTPSKATPTNTTLKRSTTSQSSKTTTSKSSISSNKNTSVNKSAPKMSNSKFGTDKTIFVMDEPGAYKTTNKKLPENKKLDEIMKKKHVKNWHKNTHSSFGQ